MKAANYANETFPKITIITPSYNQGHFIEETIRSVIDQQYPNLEYIIIDGGSTDNTVEVIKKYQQHITYWVSEKDNGQSHAINKGLKVATGSIINWLNSDDTLLPGCLQSVAAYFKTNTDTALVFGNIRYLNDNKEVAAVAFQPTKLHYYAHICIPQPAAFFSKELINITGPVDENIHFSMDWDLYVRAKLAGLHFLQVPELFCRFRVHADSKSASSFSKQFLTDNALIFYSVIKSLRPEFEFIDRLFRELHITIPNPHKLYNVSVTITITEKEIMEMIFYFLEHRCKTLFNTGNYKEVRLLATISKKYFKTYYRNSGAIKTRYAISLLPGIVIKMLLKFRRG